MFDVLVNEFNTVLVTSQCCLGEFLPRNPVSLLLQVELDEAYSTECRRTSATEAPRVAPQPEDPVPQKRPAGGHGERASARTVASEVSRCSDHVDYGCTRVGF